VPSPTPTPDAGKDYVEGLVESVSGNAIQLKTRSGAAKVGFTPSTKVTEVTPAQLADVTPGSCVDVVAASQSAPANGPTTAQSVTISTAVDGKCLPPPAPGPGGRPPTAAPAAVFGTVTSVSGNTIAVNSIGPGGQTTPADVTVTNATSYRKDVVADSHAIQNGKCMGAQGTNSGGVLQATMISLEPCPPMGHPHHQLPHLPHLPHL
jgi:hypothetical protein